MAYACPVCGAPQADGEHLADHLALTAVLHGGDHEAWLDEHAPGWAETAPDEIGALVAAAAETVEHELDDVSPVEGERPAPEPAVGDRELDPETRRAVEAARAMERSDEETR